MDAFRDIWEYLLLLGTGLIYAVRQEGKTNANTADIGTMKTLVERQDLRQRASDIAQASHASDLKAILSSIQRMESNIEKIGDRHP